MAQDYTTIRVTEAAKATAEESKRDDETWNDYIQRCTENPPEIREYVEADATSDGSDMDADEIAEAVSRELDYAQLGNKVADEVEARMP